MLLSESNTGFRVRRASKMANYVLLFSFIIAISVSESAPTRDTWAEFLLPKTCNFLRWCLNEGLPLRLSAHSVVIFQFGKDGVPVSSWIKSSLPDLHGVLEEWSRSSSSSHQSMVGGEVP